MNPQTPSQPVTTPVDPMYFTHPPRAPRSRKRQIILFASLAAVVVAVIVMLGSLFHETPQEKFTKVLKQNLNTSYLTTHHIYSITTFDDDPVAEDEVAPEAEDYQQSLDGVLLSDYSDPAAPTGRIAYTYTATGGRDPLDIKGESILQKEQSFTRFERNEWLHAAFELAGQDRNSWVRTPRDYTGPAAPLLEPFDVRAANSILKDFAVGNFHTDIDTELLTKYKTSDAYTVKSSSVEDVDGKPATYFLVTINPAAIDDINRYLAEKLHVGTYSPFAGQDSTPYDTEVWADPQTHRIIKTKVTIEADRQRVTSERRYEYPDAAPDLATPSGYIEATVLDSVLSTLDRQ